MMFRVFLIAFLFLQVASADNEVDVLYETWSLIEDGEIEPFALVLRNDVLDLATVNRKNWVYAMGATLTAVSELSWVRPGSGCAYATLINANVALSQGRIGSHELNAAIDGYAVVLAQAVENLRRLGQCCVLPSPWPYMDNSCGDYGRIYEFEAMWDTVCGCESEAIRNDSRFLYMAMTARANNVGASATAAATQPALALFEELESNIMSFLRLVIDVETCATKKKPLRAAAGALKSNIFKAASRVKSSFASKCN